MKRSAWRVHIARREEVWRRFFLVLCAGLLLLLASCKRETSVTFLIQNLNPRFPSIDMNVSFKPRSGAEQALWSGQIPYNADVKALNARSIPLNFAGDVKCCLRVVLAVGGENISESAGSWRNGKNYQRITIEDRNGTYYIQNLDTTDMPDGMENFQIKDLP
ncbi:MAG: hypothetical protein JNM27_19360 [Leptospirales bacterium]|nr:hypothetical protein [Leptospirales bacterium]